MNQTPDPIYVKFFITIIFSLLLYSNVSAQKNSEIWELLLNNNREAALVRVSKLNVEKDIENLLLKKIVEMESGKMMPNLDDVKRFSSYENYEYYLFSNWMMPYLFNDYLENGFNENTFKLPHLIEASTLSNSTVKNSLYYLQAVTRRHQRDWSSYSGKMKDINAVRDWEFCGVFENINSSGINITYEPEYNTEFGKKFDARSKGFAQWYNQPKKKEVYNFFSSHVEGGSGVHYAQTFIKSAIDQRVNLKLGKGGQMKLFVNDILVFEDEDTFITEMDSYTISLNLKKGVNRILIKSAVESGTPFFILRLEDLKGNPLNNVSVSLSDREYNISNFEDVNPKLIPHEVTSFFENRIKNNIGDENLNKFCLAMAYNRTGKLHEENDLLNDWLNLYPHSSFIKSAQIEAFNSLGFEAQQKELENNMLRQDPDYYLSLMAEFENTDKLMSLDLDAYEEKLKKIGNTIDYSFMKPMTELLTLYRTGTREQMISKLESVLNDDTLFSTFKATFSEIYSTGFNEDDKAIEWLEKFNQEEYIWEVIQYLAYYYEKQNRMEEAKNLYKNSIELFDYDNDVIYEFVQLLHRVGDYNESIPFIEKALDNYPNSYVFTKLYGDVFQQLNDKENALIKYETALDFRPNDRELRDKINDIKKTSNPLMDFQLKNPYDYIKEKRATIESNNYGLNILLNQMDIYDFRSGGEYKSTMIYEVTSQSGIEKLKEYSLGLSGNYIIHKAEIVKSDGSTVPADINGSTLVFDKLQNGDVVFIHYEAEYSKSGRFYNDYIYNHNFKSYHPSIKDIYRIVSPDKTIKYKVFNGEIDYKISRMGDLYVHTFSRDFDPGLEIAEDYSPVYSDLTTRLSISSVDSWDEIANWYSDLVRNQLRYDNIVDNEFKKIFPNGVKDLSEDEKAKRIYYYITDNFSYSHVSFRQSGYIPQRPSETITSLLGDCKDFSSLYHILAQKAGLNSNLVLILTSNNGNNTLTMPSSDFNHCIVKVNIDGKVQYLELTSKYLPYKALPTSLKYATALDIPVKSEDGTISELYHLNDIDRKRDGFNMDYMLNLGLENSQVVLNAEVFGHLASYYIELKDKKKDDALKDLLEEELNNKTTQTIKLKDLEHLTIDRDEAVVRIKAHLEMETDVKKIDDLYTVKIPDFTVAYNDEIIKYDSRNYPIDYKQYENADFYHESVVIKLDDDFQFTEVPESVNYTFKDHNFKVDFMLEGKSTLKMDINTFVSSEIIEPKDYLNFTNYVRNVLDTKEIFLKFKKSI